MSQAGRGSWRSRLDEWKRGFGRAWRAIVPLTVVALVVILIGVLAAVARGDDGDESQWAEVIAAVALLAVSVLLYLTGRPEWKVRQRFELPGYAVGTRLSEEIYRTLGSANKAKVLSRAEYDALPDAEKQKTDPWTVREPIDTTEYVIGRQLNEAEYRLLPEEQRPNLRERRGAYFRMLYTGQDGRWSTSKLQALVWTYAILFALLSLFIADQLGLKIEGEGEKTGFGNLDFRDEYLLLLGGPFAAAVLAKGFTTSKVEEGNLIKVTEPSSRSIVTGFRDVISDDQGRTDLVDFQYFLFGLIALAVFAISLIPNLS